MGAEAALALLYGGGVALNYPIGNGGTDNTDRPCTAFEYDRAGNQTKARSAITRTAGAACVCQSGTAHFDHRERPTPGARSTS